MTRTRSDLWTQEMCKDLAMLYPYLNSEKTAKILNHKHGTKRTTIAVERKAVDLNIEKDCSDGININEASKEIGCNRRKINRTIKYLKIERQKRGNYHIISFRDFDRLKSEYATENENFWTLKKIFEYGNNLGISPGCMKKHVLSKCKSYWNTKHNDRSVLYNKNNIIFYVDNYLKGNKIDYCLIDKRGSQEDVQEYYSIVEVSKMLGVSRKLISSRCGGDLAKLHPEIKYVYEGKKIIPQARIPMKAIDVIFDKLNEGWVYGGERKRKPKK